MYVYRIIPSSRQQHINTLVQRYDISSRQILDGLMNYGYTIERLSDDPNCVITIIHSILITELTNRLGDYGIEPYMMNRIYEDIQDNNYIDYMCSSLPCAVVFNNHQDYFLEHHQEDYESIQELFEQFDC